MKNYVWVLFVSFPFLSGAQSNGPRVSASLGVFYENEFNSNYYLSIGAASELFAYKFIAPEIGVDYYIGGKRIEDVGFGEAGTPNYKAVLDNDFYSIVYYVAPKLFYENDGLRFLLIPSYHFGRTTADGLFLDSNDVSMEQKKRARNYFWSFSLGLEDNRNPIHYGLYLTYTGFNGDKALNKLDFTEIGFSENDFNTGNIGLLFKVGFGFKRRQNL
ncbi:hypothetical protein [Maribacter sp. 2-571]|uniref:hypothetical protein n=1 Tax=Maribacter sp. 2-571 TaxID=3417569 RepID=UPI003D345EC0